MVITVQIGREKRDLREMDERWVNQEIKRLERGHEPLCVQVHIQEGLLSMVLSTPGCSKTAGGGRAPNAQEREIFQLWELRRLNSDDFSGGKLIAFLHQLRNVL